jgi:ketosteroid isomerase-like protein
MDAQGTMRLMFDTMDAYDRADFDRLAEIYAEDAQWLMPTPPGRTAETATTSSPCSASAGMPESGSSSTSCVLRRARSW